MAAKDLKRVAVTEDIDGTLTETVYSRNGSTVYIEHFLYARKDNSLLKKGPYPGENTDYASPEYANEMLNFILRDSLSSDGTEWIDIEYMDGSRKSNVKD